MGALKLLFDFPIFARCPKDGGRTQDSVHWLLYDRRLAGLRSSKMALGRAKCTKSCQSCHLNFKAISAAGTLLSLSLNLSQLGANKT